MTLFPDFIRFGATLRIDIAQKLTEPEDRRVVWSHADAPEIFDELHLKGDLVAEVLVSPEGPGKWTEIVVEVERLSVAKQELDEDDADVFAYKIPQGQDFVDVSECIRQLVILQEPVAPVKNPDEDFIFVSNNQPDEGSEEAKPLDPRWEKLKALKSKMENRS